MAMKSAVPSSYLNVWRRGEVLIVEKIMNFLFRPHLVRLGVSRMTSEYIDQILVFPLLDVVVLSVHAMDKSLDCVALVADEKAVKVSMRAREHYDDYT